MELAELAGPATSLPESTTEPAVVVPTAGERGLPSNGSGSAATPIGAIDLPPEGTPAGWLRDPSGSGDVVRYWDGRAWTAHVATRAIKR
jgi:hypothetical protein